MKTTRCTISRRSIHLRLSVFLLIFILSGCEAAGKPTPPPLSSTAPRPASPPTATPQTATDVPIYKNTFEEITNLTASGITSANNKVRINTENVDFQSGRQSLEAYGTLGGETYSGLTISLSVKALTGQETIDLSNKTVDFSFYVPAGSPISAIIFVARSGDAEVSLFSVGSEAMGENQGKWHYMQYNLKPIHENNAWSYTSLSNEESRRVMENCDEIVFAGMRTTAGDVVPTSFLIDDFKWIGLNDATTFPLDESLDSIRRYADARNLKISSTLFHNAVIDWYSNPWYLYTLAQEFNMTTVGGLIAPETRPANISTIEFDYTMADQMLAFAEGHGMYLRGGTGGWHTGNPRWITDGTYEELKAFLDRKIESDLTHFKGKVLYWGVFNEVVLENGQGFRNRQHKDKWDVLYGSTWAPYGSNYSPWVDGKDTSLIEYAFIKARAVDPEAKLFLNDSGNEKIGDPKSEFFYAFVTDMQNRGIPIDGVGFQLHLMYPDRPGVSAQVDLSDPDVYFEGIDRNIKRYAQAGLLVEFTEFEFQLRLDDLDLSTQAGQEEYARRVGMQSWFYARLIQLALDNPNVVSVTIWTVADKPGTSAFDWSGMEQGSDLFTFTYTDAFLFDKNYDPKPAYYTVLEALKGK